VLIRQLTLCRFGRFEDFTWYPSAGINCLVGPGDAGKTTILDAIARATSAAPAAAAAEHDYFRRRTEAGFEIELCICDLSPELKGAFRPPALWGWQGPGKELLTAPVAGAEAVLRILVRGTADLETEHRVLSPDGEELFLSVDRRRLLGLCRVGEMRGSSREFRMARGSLLERTLGREDVRGAAAVAVRTASERLQLPDEVETRLATLGAHLHRDGITTDDATLEVLSPPGQSLLGLLGLAVGQRGEAIALASTGQGTQRLASFVLARELAVARQLSGTPLVVMDEVELGLEPYRRRLLVQQLRRLVGASGQAFLTTHSSTVLAELRIDELHRLDWRAENDTLRPSVTRLGSALQKAKQQDAESLLCRLPVVCEGATEQRLVRALLDMFAETRGVSLAALGVHAVDGGGQPHAFSVIDAYRDAGFELGMFLDNEKEHSGARAKCAAHPEVVAGAWTGASCTEDALAHRLSFAQLDELLAVGDPDVDRLDERRRKQLCAVIGSKPERGAQALLAEYTNEQVRDAWGRAAHKHKWFKSRAHGEALVEWLLQPGRLPAGMAADVQAFWEGLAAKLPLPPDADGGDGDAERA
jgi:putative ATP-dependent endonuclease of OLD family